MAKQSAKFTKGDKVTYRKLATQAVECEIVSVHWNNVHARWECNILSGKGARQLNIPESDLLAYEKPEQAKPIKAAKPVEKVKKIEKVEKVEKVEKAKKIQKAKSVEKINPKKKTAKKS